MKSVYVLGISLAVGLVILYIQWQQKKKLEEMLKMVSAIQVPQQSVLDREFIIEENQRLHHKIETSYDKVYQQYDQVLIAVDNIPVIGSMNYSGDDESENIRSYHGEPLIDIEEDKDYDLSLENEDLPKESVLGVDNRSINSKVDTSNKTVEKVYTEPVNEKSNRSLPSKKNSSENNEVVENAVSIQSHTTSNGNYPKIAELKNLCRERGLVVSGNKTELVQRLLDSGYNF